VGEQECFTQAEALERELTALVDSSALPESPEEERLERWVLDA
jgi:hypothetical protein